MIEVQRTVRGDSEKMISRRTAQMMLTPVLGGWGLGPTLWGSGDTLRFGHGGANEGFRAQVMGFAQRGQGAVIMTNSDNGGPLIQEVLAAIFQEYGWSGFAPREIVPIALAPEALREFVGRYEFFCAGCRAGSIRARQRWQSGHAGARRRTPDACELKNALSAPACS